MMGKTSFNGWQRTTIACHWVVVLVVGHMRTSESSIYCRKLLNIRMPVLDLMLLYLPIAACPLRKSPLLNQQKVHC